MRPETIHRKLKSWNGMLDNEIIAIKNSWVLGGRKKYQLVGRKKYQLVGDNWDKDILPSYRTESLHLFNVYAIVDRVIPNCNMVVATIVIEHIPQMHTAFCKIYPTHLQHRYSETCGCKTEQVRYVCKLS